MSLKQLKEISMYRTITVLFLCLSLQAFASPSINQVIGFMQETYNFNNEAGFNGQESTQAGTITLGTYTYPTKVVQYLGAIGQTPSTSRTISSPNGALLTRTSSVSDGNSFYTAIETINKAYFTYNELLIPFASSFFELFKDYPSSTFTKTKLTRLENTNKGAAFALDDSNAVITQYGSLKNLTNSPTENLNLPAANSTSPLNISSNAKESVIAYRTASGDGLLAKIGYDNTGATTTYVNLGKAMSTPQCFLHQDGTSIVVFIDSSQNLMAQCYNSNLTFNSSKVIDSSVTDYDFNANNASALIAYKKDLNLCFSQADFQKTKGNDDISFNWSGGSNYMSNGTRPLCLACQERTCCMGGTNSQGYHQVLYKTVDVPPVVIFTGQFKESANIKASWATISTNKVTPILQRSFSYTILGDTQTSTGVTSSYSPVVTLETAKRLTNSLKLLK